jgi:hypothetical protein
VLGHHGTSSSRQRSRNRCQPLGGDPFSHREWVAPRSIVGFLGRTLLLTLTEERQLVEVDGLVAGAAAAGPAAQDGLQEQHRLRQR